VGQQAVLQAGEELEQVASSGEAEWRSLDPVLTDQHHRPPAVHCRRGSLGLMIHDAMLFKRCVQFADVTKTKGE